MTNQYQFECPITQQAEMLTDCEARHNKMMQGKHADIEPKICAVAHQCWMCPARSAFRSSGGEWNTPDKKPRWEEPRDKAAKLPAKIADHALRHTLPTDTDYRRAGLRGDDLIYNDHLRKLQEGQVSKPPLEQKPSFSKPDRNKPGPAPKAKPKSKMDAIDQVETDSMSKAVSQAVAEEKAKPKAKAKPAPKPKSKPAAEKPAGKKLSLAERAKLMKEKRQAAGA